MARTAHKKENEQPSIERLLAEAAALLPIENEHLNSEQRLAKAKALWEKVGALVSASPRPISPPQRPHFLRDPSTRQRRLGLEPDIDKQAREHIARAVLFGEPLQAHEREFVARLVAPDAVTLLIGNELRKKGRSPSTEAAIRRDEIAEAYFFHKALHPHAKHKDAILPDIAKTFGVSTSYVDKAQREAAPARRAEMESAAAHFAKGLAEAQLMDRKLADQAARKLRRLRDRQRGALK